MEELEPERKWCYFPRVELESDLGSGKRKCSPLASDLFPSSSLTTLEDVKMASESKRLWRHREAALET